MEKSFGEKGERGHLPQLGTTRRRTGKRSQKNQDCLRITTRDAMYV